MGTSQGLEEKMRTRPGQWVIQEYVGNPLLVGGLKFDFRIYATLISLDPVKVGANRPLADLPHCMLRCEPSRYRK